MYASNIVTTMNKVALKVDFSLTKKKQRLANDRLTICHGCNERLKTTLGDVCGECGCVLDAKTRVEDEYCDLGKW